MTTHLYVKPGEGRVLLHHQTGHPIPSYGAKVPALTYYRRRLADRDAVETSAEAVAAGRKADKRKRVEAREAEAREARDRATESPQSEDKPSKKGAMKARKDGE